MIPPIDEDVIAAVVKHLAAITGREPSELLDELRRSRESGAEAINRLFGVTRMPETLNWFDIQDVSRYLPADFALDSDYVHVKFDVDIDETGNVTRVAAPAPLPFSQKLHGIVVEVRGNDVRQRRESGKVPPALQAAVVAAAYTMRFRPAERDGRPVSIRGLRLGVGYSRDDFTRQAAT